MILKQLITTFIVTIVIDYVWLTVIAQKFYLDQLRPLLRLSSEGKIQAILPSALGVYVALALGTVFFVLPKAGGSPVHALGWGALFGLVVYAVYEFTNHSLLQQWPFKVVIIDLIWGIILGGIVAYIVEKSI